MSTGGYEGDAYIKNHQLLFLNQHHQHQQLQQQQQQQQQHQHQQQQHVYHVYHPPQASSSSSSAVIQDHSPSLIFPNIHGSSCRFTGYAGVLSRSIFLDPARQLLRETCDVSRAIDSCSGTVQGNLLGLQNVTDCGKMLDDSSMGKERQWKRTKLILDEVCRRYTHYYQQAQAVIQAFESVAGLSSAAPYVSMALQTMSKQFKCLENLISGQLRDLTNKAFGKEVISEEVVPSFRMTNCGVCGPIMANNVGFKQQPLWRPQRRLPERAVAVLRKWLFEHFLHPYPTEIDKQMLAKQTGLSRNQVSNWFINARVRLWKPMVEEVESLKLSQSHQFSAGDRNKNANEQPHAPPLDFIATQSDNQTNVNACHWKNQYPTSKPFRSDLSQITHQIAEPRNFASNEISSHHDIGTGLSAAGRRNGGVTLTLGLHQSNEVRIHEPLNLNAFCSFDFDYSDTTGNIAMDSFRRYL